jgi:ABC-type microcin C transport system permease subunit YejE
MPYTPPRTSTTLIACILPGLFMVLVLAALIQPALWAAIGVVGIVSAGVWLATLRRRPNKLS